jgi:hypothetical protein
MDHIDQIQRVTRQKPPKLRNLSDLDGRTLAARRAKELIAVLTADLGGPEAITAAKAELIKSAAVHGAMLEHLAAEWISGVPIDELRYVAIANGQRRLLVELGLERRSRDVTPSLKDYLAQQSKGKEN